MYDLIMTAISKWIFIEQSALNWENYLYICHIQDAENCLDDSVISHEEDDNAILKVFYLKDKFKYV